MTTLRTRIRTFIAAAGTGAFLAPLFVFAQEITNPFKDVNNLNDLLQKLISIAFQIFIPISVLMLMWIGVQYAIESGKGKSANLSKVHENFKFTVLGIAILLGAYVILAILQNTFSSLM